MTSLADFKRTLHQQVEDDWYMLQYMPQMFWSHRC